MAKSENLIVRALVSLTEQYQSAIESAEQRLIQKQQDLMFRLEECERVEQLKLSVIVKAQSWYEKLDDDRIESLICDDGFSSTICLSDIEDIRKVREEFGPYTVNEDAKEIHDKKKNLVSIPMSFTDQELCVFEFRLVREIPPDAPCRIVTTTRTVTDTNLVCDRPDSSLEEIDDDDDC